MTLQFEDSEATVHREARLSVFAAMECGNVERATMLMTEYRDYYPDQARRLTADVVSAYNKMI
jgi:hypothetical protein